MFIGITDAMNIGMNIGLYQNAAAIDYLEQMQAVTSHNIASSTVAGFKQTAGGVSGASMGKTPEESETDFADVMRATSPVLTTKISMEQGPMVPTGRPTDVALNGEGFFQVQLPNGGTLYTRDGGFRLDNEFKLVNKNGHEVIGDGGPLQAQPGLGEVSIDQKGNVTQGGAVVGKLAIAKINNPASLVPIAGGFLANGEDEVETVENPHIVSGHYEGSNVSGLRQMISMITTSRALATSTKVITTLDEQIDSAIKTFGETRS